MNQYFNGMNKYMVVNSLATRRDLTNSTAPAFDARLRVAPGTHVSNAGADNIF